jgi:hypothetical protein
MGKRGRSAEQEFDNSAAPPPAPAGAGKAAKRRKLLESQRAAGGLQAIVTPAEASAHPFEVDPLDHAETPFEAYRDIEPFLFRLSQLLGRRSKAELQLWDPYFCEGSVKAHLARLGFTSVHNENEDAYARMAAGPPPHDVLVSNPPFSGDHMKRVVSFCVRSGKPWLLLMPDFVSRKTWFRAAIGDTPVAYLGPRSKPYQFSAPGRDRGGAAPLLPRASTSLLPFQVFAAKFSCVWYLGMGREHADVVLPWWRKKYAEAAHCVLAEDGVGSLPVLVQPQPKAAASGGKDKPKRAWRKKVSRQRKAAAAASAGSGTQDKH